VNLRSITEVIGLVFLFSNPWLPRSRSGLALTPCCAHRIWCRLVLMF